MEVGVAGANRDDAMLAHQDRRLVCRKAVRFKKGPVVPPTRPVRGRGVPWGRSPLVCRTRRAAIICEILRFGMFAGSGVWSRSTFVVDGGSPGGLDAKGDACVAPTQIGPYPPGLAYRGVSWAPFPFAPANDRRKSANSAVRCWRCSGVAVSGWSRSTIVVDGGSSGGVDAKGDACVAPTQIGPYPPGLAYRGVSWGRSRSPLRMIGVNLRHSAVRDSAVFAVENRG